MNSTNQSTRIETATRSPQRTCVIIDDEQRGCETLSGILKRHFPELLEVGQAASVDDSVALIESTRPDIIFLDIEIIGGTGFDVLDRLDPSLPIIVITTAYSNYRQEATRYPNTWFLMKPIGISALRVALRDATDSEKTKGARDEAQNRIDAT
jgi:two-component system LytT family response regulator